MFCAFDAMIRFFIDEEKDPLRPSSKQMGFHVDRGRLAAVSMQDQPSDLDNLGITAYDQQDFEEGVMEQVSYVYFMYLV